jgi:FAD/FMN-containing dehydrogenase
MKLLPMKGLNMTLSPEGIHLPGTPSYDDAVRLWNGAIDRRPAMVVQPTSPAEVSAAVRWARANGLPISVRGGGHDWAGRALADNGLLVDMSRMRRVDVAPAALTATVSGGATAADAVDAAERHGLVPATGNFGQVGMTGLTLGGGYGPLNGVAGLALDNLVGAQLVLHDGRVVTTDANQEPELLWALRGGGGNFGVVTAMQVRLHSIPSVLAGVIMYPWHQARNVFRAYDELAPTMPDELTVQIGMVAGPDGQSVVYLAPVWSGSADPSAWIARLAGLGTPLVTDIAQMPYSKMLTLLDPYIRWGRHHEMRTRTLRSFNAGAIDALVGAGNTRASAYSGVAIHHCHGAATRVPIEDTAFGIRERHFVVEVLAAWEPDDDATHHRAWAEQVYTDLAPHSIDGGYPNLIGPQQAEQARKAYGPNSSRLAQLKSLYDPENVFTATTLPEAH